ARRRGAGAAAGRATPGAGGGGGVEGVRPRRARCSWSRGAARGRTRGRAGSGAESTGRKGIGQGGLRSAGPGGAAATPGIAEAAVRLRVPRRRIIISSTGFVHAPDGPGRGKGRGAAGHGVRSGRRRGADLAFQVFRGSVHPDWFAVREFRRVTQEGWEADIRVIEGGHAVNFRSGAVRLTEVLSGPETPLPEPGLLYHSPLRHE